MPVQHLVRGQGSKVRLSLRLMILLIVFIGLAMGWLVRGARVQQAAVAVIQRSNGSVVYDWEWKKLRPVPGARPWCPDWIVSRLGPDYFGHVVYVDLRRGNNSDIGEIAPLTRLQGLDLAKSQLTDAGLESLKRMTDLRLLYLRFTKITDEGLVHLRPLRNLMMLDLGYTAVRGEGLENIQGMTDLKGLVLGGSKVTDSGLAYLKKLPGLQSLDLWATGITDDGLANLGDLKGLRELRLNATKITDAGLTYLMKLPNLRSLSLDGERISEAAEQNLKASLPNLVIHK